jgi:type IV pilus modification protein PilV
LKAFCSLSNYFGDARFLSKELGPSGSQTAFGFHPPQIFGGFNPPENVGGLVCQKSLADKKAQKNKNCGSVASSNEYPASSIQLPETSIQNKGLFNMCYKQVIENEYRIGSSGFTLIEVLIAFAIFAIGIMALASLQSIYIDGNASARMQTEATSLAAQWMEKLKILPYNHTDLDAVGNPHQQNVGAYKIRWDVTEHTPINDVKTIQITVTPKNKRAKPVKLSYRRAQD